MNITSQQLKTIFPSHGILVDIYIDHINETMERFHINHNEKRISYFIAQIGHESAGFRYVEEIASGEKYNNRADLGNTDPLAIEASIRRGIEVGPLYKGHGLGQITGFDNHRNCGDYFGIDLVNWPELLMAPKFAALSAGWFWEVKRLNLLADHGLFEQLVRRYNGGLNGYEKRLSLMERTLRALK